MAIINITNDRESLSIDLRMHGLKGQQWIDVLTKKTYKANGNNLELNLDPYDILWLKEDSRGTQDVVRGALSVGRVGLQCVVRGAKGEKGKIPKWDEGAKQQ